jgi:hypothetical protein
MRRQIELVSSKMNKSKRRREWTQGFGDYYKQRWHM